MIAALVVVVVVMLTGGYVGYHLAVKCATGHPDGATTAKVFDRHISNAIHHRHPERHDAFQP